MSEIDLSDDANLRLCAKCGTQCLPTDFPIFPRTGRRSPWCRACAEKYNQEREATVKKVDRDLDISKTVSPPVIEEDQQAKLRRLEDQIVELRHVVYFQSGQITELKNAVAIYGEELLRLRTSLHNLWGSRGRSRQNEKRIRWIKEELEKVPVLTFKQVRAIISQIEGKPFSAQQMTHLASLLENDDELVVSPKGNGQRRLRASK